MTLHRFFATACLALFAGTTLTVQARTTEDFDENWRFNLPGADMAMAPDYDDHAWRTVQLPHDWSSEGPFDGKYASGTGYAPGGIAWYRKHFQLATNLVGKTITLEFDGVYANSEVWLNGQYIGGRPYGFSSFRCDLTGALRFGADGNVLAVRVDHSRAADARYYTGSGIYRNVRLVAADKLHIAPWGVCVTTPKITLDAASVQVATLVENTTDTNQAFTVQTDLLAPDGTKVASTTSRLKLAAGGTNEITQHLTVRQPQLWNPDTPKLYHAVSRILVQDTVVDEVTTSFGIHESHFDADQGFTLNGKSLKLKGVCLHHDAGSIGAAVPQAVLERRLRLLKAIGVNAIRTSHNPPDPGLLEACDQMGFLVMDEALDEFTPGKNKWVHGWNSGAPSRFGYSELFNQWAVTDIKDMVRRDRNHPCIVLWSIGNEIDYANDPFTHPVLGDRYRPENPRAENLVTLAKPLVAAVKSLDTTRPVTAALATVSMSDAVGLPDVLDVVGYNYQENRYAEDHRLHPKRVIYGSENGHPYQAWLAVRNNNYIAGQFLWTGVDYLGEANEWPNRANGAGLFDLCGFKKPLGWFRESLWTDQPMVHLCASASGDRWIWDQTENWNWPEGSVVVVHCYANCPEVMLYLNGELVSTKTAAETRNGVYVWKVAYQPGTLRAVGRVNGKTVCEHTLQTAGSPSRIALAPDTKTLHADGKDIAQVEFQIVDDQGVRVPDAAPEVTWTVSGPATILGIGDGDLNNSETGQTNPHRAYQGRGLVILRTTKQPGDITLQATAPGLLPAQVTWSIH